MATFSFKCPACARELRTSTQPGAGAQMRCPSCGDTFMPASESARRPTASPIVSRPLPVLLGLAAFAMLIACGVGAWLSFHGLTGADKIDPPQRPVGELDSNNVHDFVPADTSALLGIHVKALRERNQLEAVLRHMNVESMPAEYVELLRNSERILACTKPTAGRPKAIVAVLAADPKALGQLKKSPGFGTEDKLGRYAVHRPETGLVPTVLFPGDRLVLLTELDDTELTAHLDRAASKPAAPGALAVSARQVESSPLWAAWAFEGHAHVIGAAVPPQIMKGTPAVAAGVQALQRARTGMLAASPGNNDLWDLHLSVECAQATDARNLKDGIDALRTVVSLLAFTGELAPSTLKELNSVETQNQGAVATVTAQLSTSTLGQILTSHLGQWKTVPAANGNEALKDGSRPKKN